MPQLFDNDTVFDRDYLYFYETVFTAEHAQQEARLIEVMLDLKPGMDVLDIPCGNGRITNHLAALNCRVVGLDSNPYFLEQARLDADIHGVSSEFNIGDMREIQFSEQFDRIINWHNSFGYFEDDEIRQFAKSLQRALRPGGKLLVDQVNRERILKNLLPSGALWTDAIQVGEDLMIDRIRYNVETGRMDVVRVIYREGNRRQIPYSLRLLTVPEIKTWLLEAGFSKVEAFGEDGEPLRLDHRRMMIVAER